MTKLCPRGKAAAKRKFKVYPSAYANAYASKICAGKIKDPSGVKRKDFRGPKPAAKGAMMKAKSGDMAKINKVVKGLQKASKLHLGQAKTLKTIKANEGAYGAKTGVMVEREESKKEQKENVIKKIKQQRRTKQQRLEDLKKELGMKNGGVKLKNQVDPRKGLEFKKGKPKKGTSDHLGNPVEVRSAKVGKLMTAGAQSGMGRLEKSGLIKAKKGKGIMIMIAVGKKKEPTKKMAGGMTSMRPRMMNKGGGADYMNTVKARKRGNPGITGPTPKSLKEKNKLSGGGMARGSGAAIRGNKFQGIF